MLWQHRGCGLRWLQKFVWMGVVGVVLSSSASATSMVFMDATEQAAHSTAVIEAEVGGHDMIQTAAGMVYTDTTLHVRSVIAGSAPDLLNIRQQGGEIEGQRVVIPGDPQLAQGQKIVAMVREVDGRWYLTAMGLSVWVIEGNGDSAVVVRDLDIAFFEQGPRGTEPAHMTPLEFITLGALRSALAGAVTGVAP